MKPSLHSVELLPPAARQEFSDSVLTDADCQADQDSPLGAAAGWYYGGAGAGLLALALHELTGLQLTGVLFAVGPIGSRDVALELLLYVGVSTDGQLLGASGWRPATAGDERLVDISERRIREFCSEMGCPDPDDRQTADAAREAARILLKRVGRRPVAGSLGA